MSDFLRSLWWMIVSLGVLVTFHEFGHFWVARLCHVHVVRFCIGFGQKLWSRVDRHGTEFAIAAIPLGGYVKMLDEREAPVPPDRLAVAFNRKPVWQRMAIVAAGPIANLLLCVILLWTMLVIGRDDYSPTLGHPTGLAATIGLQAGDRLVAIDQQPLASWSDATIALTGAAMDQRTVQLTVEATNHQQRQLTLPLAQLHKDHFDERRVTNQLGIHWWFTETPAIVDSVLPDSAAATILEPGDQILAVDNVKVTSPDLLYDLVQHLGVHHTAGFFLILRQGQQLTVTLQPRQSSEGKWRLGIQQRLIPAPAYDAHLQYGIIQAVPESLRQTNRLMLDSWQMIGRLLNRHASLQNISGPVTIARVASASATRGADWFFYFLAQLSLSLAVVNLLPIPILDGGHLLYYLIELVKGSPLSEKAMAAGQYVGLAILAGLMGLSFYNDIFSLIAS